MKRLILFGVASALVMLPSLSQATPLVIGPATYDGNYYIYAYGDGYSTTTNAPTSLSLAANSIDSINHPASSAASLNISATPFPTITTSASANGGTGAVSGALSYQFRIVSSDPYDPGNPVHVPTIVSFKGSASASAGPNFGATTSFAIAGTDYAESYRVTVGAIPSTLHQINGISQPFSGPSFDEHKLYSIIASSFNRIDLYASAVAYGGIGGASAFIDPYIQIDPSFADAAKYHIELSAGIGNFGPLSTVPLPASLPMFGAGLLGLGALGFRRRRSLAV